MPCLDPQDEVVTVASGGGEVRQAWMSWSSGKDSTLALHAAREAGDVDVVGLVTTVSLASHGVAMHEVRRSSHSPVGVGQTPSDEGADGGRHVVVGG